MQAWCHTVNWCLKAISVRHWQVLLSAIQKVLEDLFFAKFVFNIKLVLDSLNWGTAWRCPLGLVLKSKPLGNPKLSSKNHKEKTLGMQLASSGWQKEPSQSLWFQENHWSDTNSVWHKTLATSMIPPFLSAWERSPASSVSAVVPKKTNKAWPQCYSKSDSEVKQAGLRSHVWHM